MMTFSFCFFHALFASPGYAKVFRRCPGTGHAHGHQGVE